MTDQPGKAPHRPGQNLGDDQDYTGLPDEELKRAVHEHFEADQSLDASQIEVGVDADGRITLTGSVSSEVERETAERIVSDIIGLEVATDALRVEPAAREPEPGDLRQPARGRGEQATGMEQPEFEGDAQTSEAIGTEDPMEASDEGRAWIPPDRPLPEAFAATDPAHGIAADQPSPTAPREPGRRSPRVDAAVARTFREVPEGELRRTPATENATTFKEQMRATADDRERRRRDDTEPESR